MYKIYIEVYNVDLRENRKQRWVLKENFKKKKKIKLYNVLSLVYYIRVIISFENLLQRYLVVLSLGE